MMRQVPLMSMTVEVPGGRWRIAKLRDGTPVHAPAVARFTPHEPDPDYPTIEVEVDVDAGGRAVVTKASLVGTVDRPLNSNAVRNYSMDVLATHALRDLALRVLPDGTTYTRDRSDDVAERVVAAVRARTSVGRGRLDDVAKFYEAGGVPAVMDNLVVSRSQAYRLVNQARDAGIIEAKERRS